MLPNPTKQRLLDRAQHYCARTERKPERLAQIVARDAKFFRRLYEGGNCTTEMFDRFMLFFDDYESARADGRSFDDNQWAREHGLARPDATKDVA